MRGHLREAETHGNAPSPGLLRNPTSARTRGEVRLRSRSSLDHFSVFLARGSGSVPMNLHRMPSITSSAPPPIEVSRESR